MDLEEIDRVLADDLDTGDVFRHAGHDYEVLSVVDTPDDSDFLTITVNCLSANEDDTVSVRWDDFVTLLGLTATDLD